MGTFHRAREGRAHEGRDLAAVPHAARLPDFEGVAAPEQRLAAASVAVVGAGSVGAVLCTSLARLGVGTLRIVDRGRFKSASVLTHAIAPGHEGESKAEVVAALCKAIAPHSEILLCADGVETLGTAALGADAVCLATDNLAAELEVGERCMRTCTPLLQASVHGGMLVAQVRVFGNRAPQSDPCPACLFDATEWEDLRAARVFSCEGERSAATPVPTRSPASLCALAANLLCHELLRRLLGMDGLLEDAMLEYQGWRRRLLTTPLRKRGTCAADHRRWRHLGVRAPLRAWSIQALLAAAGIGSSSSGSLAVPGLRFAVSSDGGRFVPADGGSVALAELGSARERPLAELGIGAVDAVVISEHEDAVLVHEHTSVHEHGHAPLDEQDHAPVHELGQAPLDEHGHVHEHAPANEHGHVHEHEQPAARSGGAR